MVCKSQERLSADALAKSVKSFLERRTGANEEKMKAALDQYTDCRTGVQSGK